jgi:hypothetical protein
MKLLGIINVGFDITETLTDASKDVGVEISVVKTKYTLLSYHHNAWQSQT